MYTSGGESSSAALSGRFFCGLAFFANADPREAALLEKSFTSSMIDERRRGAKFTKEVGKDAAADDDDSTGGSSW